MTNTMANLEGERAGTVRLASVVIGVLTLAAPFAVDVPPAPAQTQNEKDTKVNELVVTGSRIRRMEIDSPSPITVLDTADIVQSGQLNISDLLNELPAVGATASTAVTGQLDIGTAGTSAADLRRLGTVRTLVLVNGKRHVGRGGAGLNSAVVDLNTIPVDLVERVEVLTGGASAVYGSDAVSGVINMILKKDYEGVSLRAQGGISGDSEGESGSVSLLGGKNFKNDRGNITFFASHLDQDNVLSSERPWRDRAFVLNPADTGVQSTSGNDPFSLGAIFGIPVLANNPLPALVSSADGDGIPNNILSGQRRCNYAINEAGVFLMPAIPAFGLPNTAFPLVTFDDNNNSISPEIPQNLSSAISGDETSTSVCNSQFLNIVPDYEQTVFGGTLRYKISPMFEFFAEAKFSNLDVTQRRFPVLDFDFGLGLNVLENPFVLSGVDQANLAALQTLATFAGDPQVPFVKYQTDLGLQGEDSSRTTWRFVGGLRGDLGSAWEYELSYVYGETEASITSRNQRIEANYLAAIDAVIDPSTNEIICRENLPGQPRVSLSGGCMPLNPLGRGQISPTARDFVMTDTSRSDKVRQEVVTLVFSGDSSSLFSLPAGPIGAAFGYEYREEYAESNPSFLEQQGLVFGLTIPAEKGEFSVNEVFGEVRIPILRDVPFAQSLNLDAAVRYASYSHAGENTTWKTGLEYSPVSDIRFRGTVSRAVRVPSIADAFGGTLVLRPTVVDPCAGNNIGDPVQPNRAANCVAEGLPATGVSNTSGLLVFNPITSNPDLDPEESKAWTVGAVFAPRFLPNFALTIDYWNFKIDDAIASTGAQNVLQRCYDFRDTLDPTFCGLVDRDPVTGLLAQVRDPRLNIASLEAAGIDVGINYTLDIKRVPGLFNFQFVGTYLDKLSNFPFQDDPNVEDVEKGELGDPEFSATLTTAWANGPLTFNWDLRYIDEVLFGSMAESVEARTPRSVDAVFYHDVQARYEFSENLQIYAGINNLLDKDPPAPIGDLSADTAEYDLLGRYFYLGTQLRF